MVSLCAAKWIKSSGFSVCSVQNSTKNGAPFVLEHCWQILSAEPKWVMYNMPKPVVTKRKNNGSLEVIEDTETGSSSGDVARPMGCKKLKALEQRAHQNEVGESIAARLKDLLELNEKKLLQNKLAVQVTKKKMRFDKRIRDERIMSMDLSVMTDPRKRAYFEKKQEKILSQPSDDSSDEDVEDEVEDVVEEVTEVEDGLED
ncbi:hypothetical protein INT47_004144 [Mucor saturninus]|uniref:No apical meristem-associated C-terminal domain-containing protein n=1 Tax=Mucor saturninus TaxID=64648 RepID=A0A8H7QG56_9FUNG|nr:hypothetical protein INT47_004144 [Mucor saturninus]